MSSIVEERKLAMQEGLPATVLTSKMSSLFCSFDVKIWEELHLQSLGSVSSSANADDTEKGQHWKAEKSREAMSSTSTQGCVSFSSPSARTSFSGLSSPHRLSNASSSSGFPSLLSRSYSRLCDKAEQSPPVVKVIQTGTMSFTSDVLSVQKATINTEEPFLEERPNLAAHSTTPGPEEEIPTPSKNSDTPDTPESAETSIVLGSFPHVKYLQDSAPDVYTEPISPHESKGSIPFKWEETPGRPKVPADLPHSELSTPTLQLPPKLQRSSFSLSNCDSPFSRSNSMHAASPSILSVDGFTSKPTSVKSMWNSFVQSGRRSHREGGGRGARLNVLASDEDPWSATSIFIGSDASLWATPPTLSATLDTLCASPGQHSEVQSAASRESGIFHMDDKSSCSQPRGLDVARSLSSSSLCDGSSYIGQDLPNLAPSMERRKELPLAWKMTNRLKEFWASCRKWRSMSSYGKRIHVEAEMWEPTLATYFHSMELERGSSASGQSPLSRQRSLDKQRSVSLTATPMHTSSTAASNMGNCVGSKNGSKNSLSLNLMKEDLRVFSASPKSDIQKLILGLKGTHVRKRRKGGGWALKKLKRSSRILAAMLRGKAKGSTKTDYTKACKRIRRLSYHHMSG